MRRTDAAGGGNVCVADFETWAPVADDHPTSDYAQFDNKIPFSQYVMDTKTGLSWITDDLYLLAGQCTTRSAGGFADWRDPTLAELESLVHLADGGRDSAAPFSYRTPTRANGGSLDPAWMVNFNYDANSVSDLAKKSGFEDRFHCVRGGTTGGTGRGWRFAWLDGGFAVLDRLSGLTWQTAPSPPVESSNATAANWCASNSGGLPGKWRVPTLGELRQLANRDTKSHLAGEIFQFDAGTYFIASSPAPHGWEKFSWHILFPQGGMDHGPDWANGASTALPFVRVACVK